MIYFYFRCEELQLIERCHTIASRPGTIDEILLKHTQHQYDILKETENESDDNKLEELSSHYDAIYIHPVNDFVFFYILKLNFTYRSLLFATVIIRRRFNYRNWLSAAQSS